MLKSKPTTKLSFAFTVEDIKLIEKIKKYLEAERGKTSHVAVMRYCLREAIKEIR